MTHYIKNSTITLLTLVYLLTAAMAQQRPYRLSDRLTGTWRLNSSRVERYAACGPPKPGGTPNRCVFPTAASAPNSPGGVMSVSASNSAATTTRAPALCARSQKPL